MDISVNNKFTALHSAAQDGRLETVISAVNNGEVIDVKNENGYTPLLLAAENQHREIVKYLINAQADVNISRDSEGYTVLHHALRNGWSDIVVSLLSRGADIQVKTKFGITPLLLAAQNKRKDAFKLLLNAGADVNCSNDCRNFTLLHYASRNGWHDIVQSLLQNGADIQVKTIYGLTPLLLAAQNKHKYTVEYLINAGADINCSDWENNTLLHYASQNGWHEIVVSIINKGADIQVKTGRGKTPILLAARHGHKDIFKILFNAGAEYNCSFEVDNWTIMHCASYYGWHDIIQSLLQKGADIQVKTKFGETPLLLAARNRRKGIFKLLVNARADVNCFDGRNNYTLLHYASRNGWHDIVHSLLKNGADIHVKNKSGETPLILAAENRHKDIFELLINERADVNCSGGWNNYTLLHYASQHGWHEIVQSLLEKGANIEAKSKRGQTSLQIAFDLYKLDIANLLINAGADVNVELDDGKSPLSKLLISITPDIELIRLLIRSGAYLKSIDCERIMSNALLKELILQDIELCSQAIINEYNHKDLPKLYELSAVCKVLPHIEDMRIGFRGLSLNQVEHEVLRTVKYEIEVKGHCNVFEIRHKNLKMLACRSFLGYYDYMKKQDAASNQVKRSADFSHDKQHTNALIKIGRFY